MRTIYLDIFSGISGDMFIGAMLDLGVDFDQLNRELAKLGLEEYHLHAARGERSHVTGTKFDVHLGDHHHDHDEHDDHDHDPHPRHKNHEEPHRVGHGHGHEVQGKSHHHHEHEHEHSHSHGSEHAHSHAHHDPHDEHEHEHDHDDEHEHEHGRTFAEIRELIGRSSLSSWVKEKAVAIFRRIAAAEGRIHGRPPEEVHFHEVGAVDSIVDIVGACIALELLGQPTLIASPVVEGTGFIHCAHGRFPIPAPATLEILAARGISISQCEEPHELVTPTGAAILAELVQEFGPMKQLKAVRVGYGLGARENRTRPNVLRAVLAEAVPVAGSESAANDWESDTVAVLQTNLDDINAEVLGGFMEKALAAGAVDVFHTPVQMKKNRPGVLLTVLCAEGAADKFAELVLRETTAFGVRRFLAERRKLRRESISVNTSCGPVAVKVGRLNGKVVQASPEFESCRVAAARAGVPLKKVYEEALRGFPADRS